MRVGIYIDVPNLAGMTYSLGQKINLQTVLDLIKTKKRNIVIKKAFYDVGQKRLPENFMSFLGLLNHLGFLTIPVPKKTFHPDSGINEKSYTDWVLSFAMIDDIIENKVDIIVLISGDSDFTYALQRCQEIKSKFKNRKLIIEVFATKESLSRELNQLADKVIIFDEHPELWLQDTAIAI